MWKSREGFEVGFSSDGGGDWYISQTDEGWGEYTAEVSTLPIHCTYRLLTHANPGYQQICYILWRTEVPIHSEASLRQGEWPTIQSRHVKAKQK